MASKDPRRRKPCSVDKSIETNHNKTISMILSASGVSVQIFSIFNPTGLNRFCHCFSVLSIAPRQTIIYRNSAFALAISKEGLMVKYQDSPLDPLARWPDLHLCLARPFHWEWSSSSLSPSPGQYVPGWLGTGGQASRALYSSDGMHALLNWRL